MPNHITNILTFSCSKEKFKEIAEFVRKDDWFLGSVDFNKLIPMPDSLNIECGSRGEEGFKLYKSFLEWNEKNDPKGEKADMLEQYIKVVENDPEIFDLGKQYYENLVNYGATTWYDWRIEHWGSKWNAYDFVEANPEEMFLQFNTAWSCVPPVMEKLSRTFPDTEIKYSWADEDIGHNVGSMVLLNGEPIEENIPTDGSKEAYELAAEVMDFDLAQWGYVFDKKSGTYEYVGENLYGSDTPSLTDDAR